MQTFSAKFQKQTKNCTNIFQGLIKSLVMQNFSRNRWQIFFAVGQLIISAVCMLLGLTTATNCHALLPSF